MRKKLFTAAVAFVLSALTSNAFAFPTWQELRNEIINYYKTIDTSKQWCIDSDGDLEITYTSSSGSERKAYIMMIEGEQAIPDMPPAVCYFESTTPAKANAKKMIECADAINWALPGVGQVYYKNDAICVASSIYAYSAPHVAMQITQLGTFSSMAIDLAEKCTDYVTDSFFPILCSSWLQRFRKPGGETIERHGVPVGKGSEQRCGGIHSRRHKHQNIATGIFSRQQPVHYVRHVVLGTRLWREA